jgi:pimeloyl-ACP methyl ester carboxylesterase
MGGERRTVSTVDGRTLEVLTTGDSAGYPWVWIPGSPSSVADYPRLDDLATKLGLRLVTWSRPGYGGSSPRETPGEGPRIADDVPDVATILDALGMDEFVAVGWSGGGPRALACAAGMPDRCRAAATLASLAPIDAVGLNWMADMAPGNVADFTAALAGPEAYESFKETYFLPMTNVGEDVVAAGVRALLTPSDDVTIIGGLARWLTEMAHRAGAQGVVGARDDGLALVAPWGFDVDEITVPVAVWAGEQDVTVPFAHGRWLASNVAGAVPHLSREAGHITVVNDLEAVLRELIDLK